MSKASKGKKIRFQAEGDDSAHICRLLLANPQLKFSNFFSHNKDWEDRYNNNALYKQFQNKKKALNEFKKGTNRKFFVSKINILR